MARPRFADVTSAAAVTVGATTTVGGLAFATTVAICVVVAAAVVVTVAGAAAVRLSVDAANPPLAVVLAALCRATRRSICSISAAVNGGAAPPRRVGLLGPTRHRLLTLMVPS